MAKNIVASISEMLTPDIIGRLATASGLDRTVAGSALAAAVPTILSSLAELASTPAGARKLTNAVAQSGDLESLSNHLTGLQSADQGNNVPSSILGRGTTSVFAAGIASLLGARANSIQTLVGMATPFILSGLRRLQSAQGLDGDGLARLLVAQKETIAQAIPENLANYLRRNSPTDQANQQMQPALHEAQRFASAADLAARSKPDDAKGISWPYWALALVALGGLLWALIPSQETEISKTATVSPEPVERTAIVTPATGDVSYILRPDRNWKSIGTSNNEYVNRALYNARGEQLGIVRDILMGLDGKEVAAVISVGRYLGIGDKVVAVPFSALRTEQRDGNPRLVVDLVKEALQAAPQYEIAPKQ